MLLNFVREILEEANYEVSTAATGEEGLQLTREQKPDFVILDYLLPDLKGDEVSRRAKEFFEANRYRDYLFLHGLGVETAEALAEWFHQQRLLPICC